jgi:heterodisulfide reductase subunit D
VASALAFALSLAILVSLVAFGGVGAASDARERGEAGGAGGGLTPFHHPGLRPKIVQLRSFGLIGGHVTAENGARDVDKRVLDEWRTAAYNCFSSGHKFCREVCPVLQVTYVNCTQCGACELRCPNTIFAGDFYRIRTRTVDLVKASE